MKIYYLDMGSQHGYITKTLIVSDLPHSIGTEEIEEIKRVLSEGNIYHLKINLYDVKIINYIITN